MENNQSIAKRGSGPRTDAGKERSSRNAMKHGCTSEKLVVPGEDGEEVQTLVRSAEQAVGLPGEIGHTIARQLALGVQREERICKVEESLTKQAIAQAEDRSNYPETQVIQELTKMRDGCRELKEAVDAMTDNPPEERQEEKLTAVFNALREIASMEPANNRSTKVAIDSVQGLLQVRRAMQGEASDLFAKAACVIDSHLKYVEGLLEEQNRQLDEKIAIARENAAIPDLKDLKRLDKYRAMNENSVLRRLKMLSAMKELSTPTE